MRYFLIVPGIKLKSRADSRRIFFSPTGIYSSLGYIRDLLNLHRDRKTVYRVCMAASTWVGRSIHRGARKIGMRVAMKIPRWAFTYHAELLSPQPTAAGQELLRRPI